MSVKVKKELEFGDSAPDFILSSNDGKEVSLIIYNQNQKEGIICVE